MRATAGNIHTKGRMASTIGRWLSTLSSFYNYCQIEDILDKNPAPNVRRPRVHDESRTLGRTARNSAYWRLTHRVDVASIDCVASRPCDAARPRRAYQPPPVLVEGSRCLRRGGARSLSSPTVMSALGPVPFVVDVFACEGNEMRAPGTRALLDQSRTDREPVGTFRASSRCG